MSDPFARLGTTMVQGRWAVVAVWLTVLAVAGGLLAPRAAGALKAGGYTAPDSESARAAAVLDQKFNASTSKTAAIVFRSATQTVTAPAFRSGVTDATTQLQQVPGVRRIESFYTDGNPELVSTDRHTAIALAALEGDESDVQKVVPKLRDALKAVSLEHYVTGVPAVNYDLELASEEDLHRSELFTIPIVVLLLLLVFRTVVAAAVALLVGGASIVLALSVLGLIASVTNVSVFALNVTSMIGLALGIDFSLIVISRFREEISTGRSPREAAALTMATSGRSITFSGVIVVLAMLLLTALFNLVIVRSISLAVMLVATTALLTGLALLPAVLGILGHRIDWLQVMPRRRRAESEQAGLWYRLSKAVMRRPWLWLAASLVVLGVIALPIKDLSLYGPSADVLPSSKESAQGVRVINEAFGANRLVPVQIVIRTDKGGVFKPEFLDALAQLTNSAAADPRNQQVFSLATLARGAGLPDAQFRSLTPRAIQSLPGGAQFASQFVNLDGGSDTAVVTILSKYGQYSDEHQAFVRDLRREIIPSLRQLRVYDVLVGGDSATFIDFRDAMYSRFPYLVAGVMLISYVILLMFFQSLLLPIKAIVLNLVSVLATYGALVLIFQHGYGQSVLRFTLLGRINVFIPAVLFAILFSISADYEVFLLSRVKEYYRETGDNEEAVARGLGHTAGVITAAGLILIGTFGSFSSASVETIKEIGLGLAIGVFFDSTIVRVIMVPATMRLLGARNWWMPLWLKRIVPEIHEAPFELLVVPPPLSPDAGAAAGVDDSATIGTGRLVPTGGSVGTDLITLSRSSPFRIGRERNCQLQLFDQRVSRQHALIDFADGDFYISDLHSANGVQVNGQRIAERRALHDGDLIEIGNMGNVTFVYQVLAAERRTGSIATS